MAEIIRKRECKHCKSIQDCRLVKNIAANGAIQVYWLCSKCNRNAHSNFISHVLIENQGIDISDLPLIDDYRGLEKCAVCGAVGVELHHYAPRHLFGDDCEKWPTGYLCKDCHKTWHDKVTPDMCRSKGDQ